jgi:hypothetical protein
MCAAILALSRLIPKKAGTLGELVAATDYGMPKAMAGAHALPRCPEERSRIRRSDPLNFAHANGIVVRRQQGAKTRFLRCDREKPGATHSIQTEIRQFDNIHYVK